MISSRVIEFWCFSLPVALGGGGWVDMGGGGWGVYGYCWGWLGGAPHTCGHAHACMHAHACTCMRGKHDNFMQMATPIGFGEIPGIPYDVIHVCACMCVCPYMCTCVDGILSPTPTPIHQTLLPRAAGSPKHQNSITLEIIEIIRFCLKILYLRGGDLRNQSKFNNT